MDRITPADLRKLAAVENDPCVSIAMPLHKTRPDTQQDPIRFRNLLDQAESRLVNHARRAVDARNLLQPARELQSNSTFWRPSDADGLIVLLAPDRFETLHLPERVGEHVMVGPRFFLGPLIRSCREEDDFYLLALSGSSVRLFLCRSEDMQPVELPEDMPTSMEEALAGTELEKSLQSHIGSSAVGRGRGDLIMHGHGSPKDDMKQFVKEYFQIVCRHLEPLWRAEPRPLVLAAVDYCHAIFRRVCKYPNVVEDGVTGSPDEWNEHQLFERAQAAAEPILQQGRKRALQLGTEALGTERASAEIEAILLAAEQGRVDTLLLTDGTHIWGRFDPEQAQATVHDSAEDRDEDLLNLAAAKTMTHGGRAYVYDIGELPQKAPAVALFRW